MSDTFSIVQLSSGYFRVEKLVTGEQTTAYVSATFDSRRAAQEWIEQQRGVPRELRIDYTVAPSETETHRVSMVRTDRDHPEVLGEFSTVEDANEFIRRMRELDAGETHGSNP